MGERPIYLVDDDEDDYEFLKSTLEDLNVSNKLRYFSNGTDFLNFIKTTSENPLLIICDVNIAPVDGFEIRKVVKDDSATKHKSIPFIFWSNSVSEAQIQKAYDLAVHGFFVKGNTMDEMKSFIKTIIEYWQRSKSPA